MNNYPQVVLLKINIITLDGRVIIKLSTNPQV